MFRSEERFSRNAETDLVCRLLLEKKKDDQTTRRWRYNANGMRMLATSGKNRPTLFLLEHRPKGLAALGCRIRLLRHDDLRLRQLRRTVAVEVEVIPARLPDRLALGIRRIETDELVNRLSIADRPRKGRENRGGAKRLRVDLRERRHRCLGGELVARDGDAFLAGDRVQHQK